MEISRAYTIRRFVIDGRGKAHTSRQICRHQETFEVMLLVINYVTKECQHSPCHLPRVLSPEIFVFVFVCFVQIERQQTL